MSKVIIVTRGDDLGNTHSANKAIYEGMTQGVLRNASLMANCPHVLEAAEMFAGRKEFCIGLHANINSEWDDYKWKGILPQSEVPDLYDETGNLYADNSMLHLKKPRIEQILAEVDAQLNHATRLGFDIRYVDQHMGFTWVVDGLLDAFNEWGSRKGLVTSIPNRKKFWYERNIDTEKQVANFVESLSSLEAGLYLSVGHPSFDDAETRGMYHKGVTGAMIAQERDADRRCFSDPSVVAEFERLGIRAARYDEV